MLSQRESKLKETLTLALGFIAGVERSGFYPATKDETQYLIKLLMEQLEECECQSRLMTS